jgi:Zn finger protein HypA/HybF involved in hydrogenase expression
MSSKIICPICDEELGNSVAEIPDKCPICDTRKYEIVQELKEQGEFKEAANEGEVKTSTPTVSAHEPQKETAQPVVEQSQKQVIVEEEFPENEGVIFNDMPSATEDRAGETEAMPSLYSDSSPVLKSEEQNSDVIFGEGQQDAHSVVFEGGSETAPATVETQAAPPVTLQSEEVTPPARKSGKYRKSGASDLETFPLGFKYCPACQHSYSKNFAERACPACPQHPSLQVHDSGFPPGNYLVLYNDARKAISYFCLDNAGSVIIGRSSERNSPNDIDLAAVWKNYYEKNCPNPDEIKEKMRLLKGVSSKHALVRYVATDKKYVLFHLTDKNFTVVQLPDGEKRERSAQNKTRVELVPNALIMLGDQQNFIILRYKVITLAKQA